jgi:hypothetical protein
MNDGIIIGGIHPVENLGHLLGIALVTPALGS